MRAPTALAVALLAATAPAAGTVPTPEVKGQKVLLENERVRVVEFVLQPGIAMGMHEHPRDRVEITLSPGRVRVTQEDGSAQESDEKEGVVFTRASPRRHDVVNIGTAPLRAIHVELK
jgi:quercetin dioxygenase-like cupin family protein